MLVSHSIIWYPNELILNEHACFNDMLYIRCRSFFLSFSYNLTRIFLLFVWWFFAKCIMCIILVTVRFWSPGPLLLTWINFYLCMDKSLHTRTGPHGRTVPTEWFTLYKYIWNKNKINKYPMEWGWNYISIPKLHCLHYWSYWFDE